MTGRGGTCGSGFSRELLAPSPAKAGEGWGGVPSGSVRTVSTPSQPPLPSQGEGPKQELAAEAAPTGIRAASGGAPGTHGPGIARRLLSPRTSPPLPRVLPHHDGTRKIVV